MTSARSAVFVTALLCICGAALWLWVGDGAQQIAGWAAEQQRNVQGDLAGALRSVRAGEPWAVVGLLGLCFAYGFFHAAGPGHGKLVMGGYALGEDVPRARLIGLTLAGSLGQAVTAILLVGLGALVLGWGRRQMTDLADGSLAMMSAGAIALVGLWLVARGIRRMRRAAAAAHAHDHDHDHAHDHAHGHSHDHTCAECGHAHGPDPRDVARVSNWREGLGLVLAVAVRPCTGAVFILILTFGMGIAWIGMLGALVMGLGTAVLTLCVALGAGFLRSGFAAQLNGSQGVRAMGAIEVLAGAVVAILSTQILLRLL